MLRYRGIHRVSAGLVILRLAFCCSALGAVSTDTMRSCPGDREALINEYAQHFPTVHPTCGDFNKTVRTVHFQHGQLTHGNTHEWSLIAAAVVAPGPNGRGIDALQDASPQTIFVEGGFRSPVHNLDPKIKGAPNSRHPQGQAIDVRLGTHSAACSKNRDSAACEADRTNEWMYYYRIANATIKPIFVVQMKKDPCQSHCFHLDWRDWSHDFAHDSTTVEPPIPDPDYPTTVTFAPTRVGDREKKTVTIRFPPNVPPAYLKSAKVSDGTADFALDSITGAPQLVITFSPQSEGDKTGTLQFFSSAREKPYSIRLSGLGVRLPQGPITLDVEPRNIEFDDQKQGTCSSAQTLHLSNHQSNPIGSMRIVWEGNTDAFSFDRTIDASVNKAGLAIDAHGSLNLSLQFCPTSPGVATGHLSLRVDESVLADITLRGKGTQPKLTLIPPTAAEFGYQRVGTTSPGKLWTIRNTGDASLSGIVIDPAIGTADDFSTTLAGARPDMSLPPDKEFTLAITFSPSHEGRTDHVVLISAEHGSQSARISTAGIGAEPVLSLDKSSLSFGRMRRRRETKPMALRISNDGNVPAENLSVNVEGRGGGAFRVILPEELAAPRNLNVAPHSSTIVRVVFSPAHRGNSRATLSVILPSPKVPAPIKNNPSVTLTGRGILWRWLF